MLRSLKELNGYKLQATDGELGGVRDFYFDDRGWRIRYLVADTARWLPGRRVLISPAALGAPSWPTHLLPVYLSKERIKGSPDADSDRPVSRQHEIELASYYKWPEWWGTGGPVVPPLPPIEHAPASAPARTSVLQPVQNAHLRSLSEVLGYRVTAGSEGTGSAEMERIGRVDDLIADVDDWIVRYFVVDAKEWRPGGQVLLSTTWVERIDWTESSVHTSLSARQLRECPPYHPSEPVNREYEQKLFDYHGRPAYWL